MNQQAQQANLAGKHAPDLPIGQAQPVVTCSIKLRRLNDTLDGYALADGGVTVLIGPTLHTCDTIADAWKEFDKFFHAQFMNP